MTSRYALIAFAAVLLTAIPVVSSDRAEARCAAHAGGALIAKNDAPPRDAAPKSSAARRTPVTVPPLDLPALEKRLRETRAIGVFTKLSLKNQVDDLLDQFRDFHRGRGESTLDELRERYSSLMVKVLSLLERNDPPLANDLAASREAIWIVLEDPIRFSKLSGGG